ncbi:signal peptidase II [candidate division KSB3 bacterium]|uniref:Lipoprotein signal peptidase n=1 Tax=candidate division KSB3 bacterium TaxID=2044937 RepID=A0A9D5JSZ7_9BACT|nr:signal peptidase II [candidate division KSB3 bacterium]MBD3323694.1 signal peptidase II [candidate division KSB3 bacterium]
MVSLAVVIVIVDQYTKWLIEQARPSMTVIPGFFNLTYARNTGAAFGILQGKQTLLTVVSVIAIGILVFLLWYERPERRGFLVALALILGGTCGNFIDRVRQGYVVDFLDVYISRYHWPSFNVADSAITVGVGLLIIVTFLEERKQNP